MQHDLELFRCCMLLLDGKILSPIYVLNMIQNAQRKAKYSTMIESINKSFKDTDRLHPFYSDT